MIAIGFDRLLTLFALGGAVALALSWARERWRAASVEWNLSQQQLCRCRECGYIFLSGRIESMSRCPHCQNLTRVRKRKSAKRIKYT